MGGGFKPSRREDDDVGEGHSRQYISEPRIVEEVSVRRRTMGGLRKVLGGIKATVDSWMSSNSRDKGKGKAVVIQ